MSSSSISLAETRRHVSSIRSANDRLLQALLEDAVQTFKRCQGAGDATSRQTYRETERWFASEDRSSPFSFENICERLDLDSGSVRDALRRYQTAPAPRKARRQRYRTRMCGGIGRVQPAGAHA